jgi:hypothetical protein
MEKRVIKEGNEAYMRVLSQSEIDNILAELLENPSVLPDDTAQKPTNNNENNHKTADS